MVKRLTEGPIIELKHKTSEAEMLKLIDELMVTAIGTLPKEMGELIDLGLIKFEKKYKDLKYYSFPIIADAYFTARKPKKYTIKIFYDTTYIWSTYAKMYAIAEIFRSIAICYLIHKNVQRRLTTSEADKFKKDVRDSLTTFLKKFKITKEDKYCILVDMGYDEFWGQYRKMLKARK